MECVPSDHLHCDGGGRRTDGSSLQQPEHKDHHLPDGLPPEKKTHMEVPIITLMCNIVYNSLFSPLCVCIEILCCTLLFGQGWRN